MATKRIMVIKPFQKKCEFYTYDGIKEKYGLDPMEVDRLVESGEPIDIDGKPVCFDEADERLLLENSNND